MSRNSDTKHMRPLGAYDENYDTDQTTAILRKLALSHAREVANEAEREFLLDCLNRCDYRALCDRDPSYPGLSPSDARHARQARAFFQKRDDLELGVDRGAVAREKFLQAEDSCRLTNECFRSWSRGGFQFHPDVESVLHTAQQKISSILGECPSLSALKLRFGPGATTLRKKMDAHPRYKLGDAFCCSESLLPLMGELLAETPGWAGLSEGVEGVTAGVEIHCGRVAFVPKNWKAHRAIVVEPMSNTMFQLAIGDVISQRLRLVGIDLKDQTRNQRMARIGSLTGALATLDLSSASDTISKELVAHLLPLDWYIFLSYGRTPVVDLDGKLLRQEKFSSMGNGFTFPLETLIFYALAWASCTGSERKDISVYGDDIILPVWRYGRLCKALCAVGFTPNDSKSFWYGSFRESCGKDYLLGKDIRPKYITGRLSAGMIFELHNFYWRSGDYLRANSLLVLIQPSLRLFGPDGYGDGHLLGGSATPHNRRFGWGGYIFDTWKLGGRSTTRISRGDYVLPLYTVYARYEHCDSPEPLARQGWHMCSNMRDRWYHDVCEDYMVPHKDGTRVTLPGTKGCKRISIYTLTP